MSVVNSQWILCSKKNAFNENIIDFIYKNLLFIVKVQVLNNVILA